MIFKEHYQNISILAREKMMDTKERQRFEPGKDEIDSRYEVEMNVLWGRR